MQNVMESNSMNGSEVVVSGISGIFPKSDSVMELSKNLYNKVNMVVVNHSFENDNIAEIPKHMGKISGLDKFDPQFFKVSYWQAQDIDPMCVKLMEHTFSAIFDAGINPVTLTGKRIGVYVGSSFNNHFAKMIQTSASKTLFGVTGFLSTMLANRISFWLDSKSPSYTVDSTCVSSSLCLEIAVNDIKRGLIDAAIVGGTNACDDPILNYNLRKAGLLCLDGKTKSFDINGDGYVRSEAVNSIFLQRARDAKRIYAEICHVKCSYYMSPGAEFLPIREVEDMEKFFRTFYEDINVSPYDIEYVEANGAGIAEADKNEIDAIDRVFGSDKQLKIGSLKSNIGHTEAASGICSVTKMCLAYHCGKIPANLHYAEPLDTDAIRKKRLQVIVKNTLFDRGFTAINNFSFTGGNSHMLMKGHYKSKDKNRYRSSIPYLVVASGTGKNSVNKIFNLLRSSPVDAEQIALLHNIYQFDIPGHTGRGFAILDLEEKRTICLRKGFEYYPGEQRPVCFVYSGMGSQWTSMGAELLRIPIFAKSIKRLQNVLEEKRIDIIEIITTKNRQILSNILNCFVGITAIQIALTDVLRELGIAPDYMIGHSLREHGCAYADGCLSAEDTILSSYYRGIASVETEFIHGSMVAVGLGYNQIKKLCPPEIEIACHNSSNSSTLSGPADIISKFAEELTKKGIFVKEVTTANIAYHSKYVAEGGAKYLKLLEKLITNPKKRSSKWLCTSQPEEIWNTAEYCTGEYFTNNFINPVYFEEAAVKVPENAILIEIAPHGLLQAILKRSHSNCINVSLTRKQYHDSVTFFLEAIGRLYQAGLNPKVHVLYPEVEFPVSTETPLLSHFIEWEHNEEWPTESKNNRKQIIAASRTLKISIVDEDYAYFKSYTRNGINMFPEAAILVFVWETLAMYKEVNYRDLSVLFKQVYFGEKIIIPSEKLIELHISIQKGSRRFEVSYENTVIANGFIDELPSKNNLGTNNLDKIHNSQPDWLINSYEIYNLFFKNKSFYYGDSFQSIKSFTPLTNEATIKWQGNWITFLDGLIQLNILVKDSNTISRIKFIDQLSINVHTHPNDKKVCYNATVDDNSEVSIKCGGITLETVIFNEIQNESTLSIKSHFMISDSKDKLEIASSNNEIHTKIIFPQKQDLASWQCIESKPDTNENLIKLCYIGIFMNYYDEHAIGEIKENDNFYGMNFSGFDNRGQRVMGISTSSMCKCNIPDDTELIWPVPEHWSMEDAATVPLPYLLAYYCLTVRSQVMEGFTVLITDGASAFGQALISVCLFLQCNVYATVSNDMEKKLLLKLFPAITETKIAFNHKVMLVNVCAFEPPANYCQIVVNCGSRDLRQACLNFVSISGMFLDVSEEDMKNNRHFGMYYLFQCKNYVSVRTFSLFRAENIEERTKLKFAISEGVAKGIVKPLARVVYLHEETSQEFPTISKNQYKGSILFNMGLRSTFISKRTPRTYYEQDDVIVVICDENGVAIELVDHLINEEDIQIVVLHARQNFMTNYIKWKILKWKKKGVLIFLRLDNLELEGGIENLLHESAKLGNLTAVFVDQDNKLNLELKRNISILQDFGAASSSFSLNIFNQKEKYYPSGKPEKKTNFEAGLGAFFSLLKEDDFMKKESIIKMKTLTSTHYEEEINAESVHLIIIPGFEGHHRIFEDIAEKLKVAAITLQITPYMKYKSIEEIAAVYYKDLKMTIKVQATFYILGYSFGVNVAIELAALMENEGHTGIIFCLDSSPEAIQVHLDAYLSKPTNDELQNAIIEHVYEEVTGQNSKELKEILTHTENEEEKILKCLLRSQTLEYSNEYLTFIIMSTYKRMLLAREYKPNLKLVSELVLIRGISHPKAESLSEDYDLSKITKNTVQIINIDSDHALAPYDFQIATIINKMLDPKHLREFNNRNFCDTYFVM